MEDLEIELKYDPHHFRELYYKNGEGSVFTARATKKPIWIIIFLIAATIIIYGLSFRFERLSLFIIYAIMGTIAVIIYAYEPINFYLKWKKDIEGYLKEMSKYKNWAISLTEHSFEMDYDSETVIETWDKISSVHITDLYVAFAGGNGQPYLFPAKSMKKDDYNRLREFVRHKIK